MFIVEELLWAELNPGKCMFFFGAFGEDFVKNGGHVAEFESGFCVRVYRTVSPKNLLVQVKN